jgi:hypothetical protein
MTFAVYAYTTSTFPYDQFSICGSLTMRHPGQVAVLLEIDENIEIISSVHTAESELNLTEPKQGEIR